MKRVMQEKYPEGHFVNMWVIIGIVIFSGLGVLSVIITHNHTFFVFVPGLGVAFGLAIGQVIENKYKKEDKIRPLTEDEKKLKKMAISAGIVLLILGVIVFRFFNS
jgi:hypothetical protein